MIPHPVEFAAAVSLAVVLLIAAAAVFRPRKPNGIASYGERRGP